MAHHLSWESIFRCAVLLDPTSTNARRLCLFELLSLAGNTSETISSSWFGITAVLGVNNAMGYGNDNYDNDDDSIDPSKVKRRKKDPSRGKAGRWTDSERRAFLVGLQQL